MDRRHAFILLAGAIGLSGMSIGKMVNLSHSTTYQRFQMMNNVIHLKKVIKKYGLQNIEYLPGIGAHADWRRFAYRFPRLRNAFARYRDGKATEEDCFLIVRILKNQMAANGMKVNVNAIGRITCGTVDALVARMRKAGMKPYLLHKPRKRQTQFA